MKYIFALSAYLYFTVISIYHMDINTGLWICSDILCVYVVFVCVWGGGGRCLHERVYAYVCE